MKVYIDLLFLFNCWIDFFLLIIVKLTLKRTTFIHKIIIASFIGGITTFCVFLNINYVLLFLIKSLLSVVIVLVAFGYKNVIYTIKNVIYLFMVGIIFGGFASYVKINMHNKYYYLLALVLISPLLVLLFNYQNKKKKNQYNLYYQVKIIFNNKKYLLCGFLDSGNNLKDPITHKYIIIVNKTKLKGINKIRSPMYVPIKTVNNSGLIKCFKPDQLFINNKEYKEYLIGITEQKISLDGIDCLLNNRLLEDL